MINSNNNNKLKIIKINFYDLNFKKFILNFIKFRMYNI